MKPRPDEHTREGEDDAPDRRDSAGPGAGLHNRWGRLNSGQRYNVLAMDIDRAIAFARLGIYETIILQQVRERCWGMPARSKKGRDNPWPEHRPCRLRISELARKTGIHPRRLFEALAWLIEARILIEHADGSLSINKAVNQWANRQTGKPRFTAKELNFFAEVWPDRQEELPLEPDEDRPQAVRSGAQGSAFKRTRECVQTHNGVRLNALRPIEERTREFRFSEESERGGERPESPPPDLASLSRAPEADPAEGRNQEQAELDAIARQCLQWFPARPEVAQAVADRQGDYPVAWYREAAERLRRHPPDKHCRDYFMGILNSYRSEGGPPQARPAQAARPPAVFRASPEERAILAALKYPGRAEP